jgi:hypothetical protein
MTVVHFCTNTSSMWKLPFMVIVDTPKPGPIFGSNFGALQGK